jgi:hypothetical protein
MNTHNLHTHIRLKNTTVVLSQNATHNLHEVINVIIAQWIISIKCFWIVEVHLVQMRYCFVSTRLNSINDILPSMQLGNLIINYSAVLLRFNGSRSPPALRAL